VREKLSSGETTVRGDQWPLLLYANQEYDSEDPWEGLFRNQLLIWVSHGVPLSLVVFEITVLYAGFQTHLHLA